MRALPACLRILLPSAQQVSGAGQMSLLFDLVAAGIHRQLLSSVSCNFTLALGIATQRDFQPLLCLLVMMVWIPAASLIFIKDFFSCLAMFLSA